MNYESRTRQRAHEIWEQLGRPEGQAEDHWRQAEADLGLDEREELPNASRAEEGDAGPEPQGTAAGQDAPSPGPGTGGPATPAKTVTP
jgi:hypothetical protein